MRCGERGEGNGRVGRAPEQVIVFSPITGIIIKGYLVMKSGLTGWIASHLIAQKEEQGRWTLNLAGNSTFALALVAGRTLRT
jgi:hypothetical protein